MKKRLNFGKITVAVVLALTGAVTQASPRQPLQRPVMQCDNMQIVDARGEFENVERAYMTLIEDAIDGSLAKLNLRLDYHNLDTKDKAVRFVSLYVNDVTTDSCGIRTITATLRPVVDGLEAGKQPLPNEHRFGVVLTDHSRDNCDHVYPFVWEASVREGYGWCGTDDATMTLLGNPEVLDRRPNIPTTH